MTLNFLYLFLFPTELTRDQVGGDSQGVALNSPSVDGWSTVHLSRQFWFPWYRVLFSTYLSYIEDRDFFAPDHVVSRGGHVESRSIGNKIHDGYYLSDHTLLLSTVSIWCIANHLHQNKSVKHSAILVWSLCLCLEIERRRGGGGMGEIPGHFHRTSSCGWYWWMMLHHENSGSQGEQPIIQKTNLSAERPQMITQA